MTKSLISIVQGDITKLAVDAIVNAANILDSFYENVSIDYFQACKDYVDAFVKSMDEKSQINLASNTRRGTGE